MAAGRLTETMYEWTQIALREPEHPASKALLEANAQMLLMRELVFELTRTAPLSQDTRDHMERVLG